jgi:hypothetical protein
MAPTTVIYMDDRDAGIIKRFNDALARAKAAHSGKGFTFSPVQVLGEDAPLVMSPNVQTLVMSDMFSNTVLSRNDNPEALAEVGGHVGVFGCGCRDGGVGGGWRGGGGLGGEWRAGGSSCSLFSGVPAPASPLPPLRVP